jgi:hypothetical protein
MTENLLQGKYYTFVPFDLQRAIDPAVACGLVLFKLKTTNQRHPVYSEEEGRTAVAETCRWLRDMGYKYFKFNPKDKCMLSIQCIHVTRYGHDTASLRWYNSQDGMHVDLLLQ